MNKVLVFFFLFFHLAAFGKEPLPPSPWEKAEKENLPPGVPYKDYTPAIVPNGSTAKYKVIDGVKVFHLIAEPLEWEVAQGFTIHTWGFNKSVPGPLIEVTECSYHEWKSDASNRTTCS